MVTVIRSGGRFVLSFLFPLSYKWSSILYGFVCECGGVFVNINLIIEKIDYSRWKNIIEGSFNFQVTAPNIVQSLIISTAEKKK